VGENVTFHATDRPGASKFQIINSSYGELRYTPHLLGLVFLALLSDKIEFCRTFFRISIFCLPPEKSGGQENGILKKMDKELMRILKRRISGIGTAGRNESILQK
jgi:hypothetical protein